MENDIDLNEYYVLYHILGAFDCCWITPHMRIPKDVGRAYLKGDDYAKQVIIDLIADFKEVPSDSVKIIKVTKKNEPLFNTCFY